MGNIKTKVGILLLTSLLVASCKEEKTAVFNLNLEQHYSYLYGEHLMVQNPPENIDSIISFFNKEVRRNRKRIENNIKKIIIERNINIDRSREEYKNREEEYLRDWKNISEKDIERCVAHYYKEQLFFDRNYTIPTDQPLFLWMRFFIGYDIRHNGHDDARFIEIFYKYDEDEKDEPVTPFLYINQLDIYYYPKGLRNNPNIHWEKLKQPEEEGYYYRR